jgi:uncharacterized protein (TIGR02466 family)
MNNKIFINPIFSTPIAIFKIDLDNKKIINFLNKLDFELNNSSLNNEANCFISKSYNLLKEFKLKELEKKCFDCTKEYIDNIMEYNIKFKIINSWATKTLKGGYSQPHHHSHSLFSAVYYPKGNKEFKIKFIKNKYNYFWRLPVKKYNSYNSENIIFPIEDNIILIFPSDLKHEIIINNSNETRYSIAFNINPIGFIGSKDNRVEFK